LFEAGMAKGKLDTPILGVALGIELGDASSGPFAQFQNCGDDEDSLTKLVFQLVSRIPNAEPDNDTIKFQVGKFRTSVAEVLRKLDAASLEKINANKTPLNVKAIENSSAKLFEEIKIMFQDLPARIERSNYSDVRKRKRRVHPKMIEEVLGFNKNPKIGIRVALSFFRERMPWIYDEGINLLNKLELVGPFPDAQNLVDEFEDMLMQTTRNPFAEDFLFDEPEDFLMMMEVARFILSKLAQITRTGSVKNTIPRPPTISRESF
jgi:hypothetical protein